MKRINNRKDRSSMGENLICEEDLKDLLEQLQKQTIEIQETEEEIDPEVEASKRRYMEIIKKHKEEE